MDNQENMIKNIFKNEIQIKRINKGNHVYELRVTSIRITR